MTPIRVVLVDDHPVVRAGIRNLLENERDIVVVGETSEGAEVISLVKELAPDILLLDMELPGISGTEVARQLQESEIHVNILALSAYDDKQFIQGLLSSGAAGYLVKDEVPEAIIDAVRGVARGEQGWVSRRIAAQMSNWMKDESDEHMGLTPREMEVLRGVVDGKTNQEIGLTLGISEKTVEKHLDGIFTKLGVASRVEAAVYAVREGWE